MDGLVNNPLTVLLLGVWTVCFVLAYVLVKTVIKDYRKGPGGTANEIGCAVFVTIVIGGFFLLGLFGWLFIGYVLAPGH